MFNRIKSLFKTEEMPLQTQSDAITSQVIEALERNERASERLRDLLVNRNNEMADTVNSIVGNMK